MSLLNEMLNDLNKKKPKHPEIAPMPMKKRALLVRLPQVLGWLVVLAMGCFLALITWLWLKPSAVARQVLPSKIVAIPPLQQFHTLSKIRKQQVTMTRPMFIADGYQEQLDYALNAIQEGEDARAIELLTEFLKAYPDSIEASESLAGLYLTYTELDKASEVLDKALSYDPHHLRLSMMKSRVLVEQANHQEALHILEKFNPDMSKMPEYYALLAAIFNTIGRTDEAGSLYQALMRVDPNNGQYALGLGISLESRQAFQQAIAAYHRASQSEYAQPAVRAYAENRLKLLQG